MKIVYWFDKHFEEVFMVLLLTTITVVMLLQIIMRYFFNNSLAWPEELCRYCFIWFMFIGFSYSTMAGTNLRVDAIVNMCPSKVRESINVFGMVCGLIFTAYMFTCSAETISNAYRSHESSVAMGLPIYFVHTAAFVGFGLSTIRYVQRLARRVVRRNTPNQEESA